MSSNRIEVPDWVRGGTAPKAPVSPLASPPRDAPLGQPHWTLEMTDGRLVPVDSAVYIGREPVAPKTAPTAALVSVGSAEKSVSKTHVAVVLQDSAPHVIDLHSTNGVYLESSGREPTKTAPGETVPLRDGDVIRFGSQRITVRHSH